MRRYSLLITTLLLSAWVCTSTAEAPTKWIPYQNATLGFQVKLPATWVTKETAKAVAFRDTGDDNWHAAFGVLKSSDKDVTIEEAAQRQETKEQAKDWIRSAASVAGHRAVKIVGTPTKNPGLKMVEYYVEADNGYLLIQCLAIKEGWPVYAPVFATMLRTFSFLY